MIDYNALWESCKKTAPCGEMPRVFGEAVIAAMRPADCDLKVLRDALEAYNNLPRPPKSQPASLDEVEMLHKISHAFQHLAIFATPEALTALLARLDAAEATLRTIEAWSDFPATGKFWDEEQTRPTSYAAEYGSNGERDYMRSIARATLKGA